MNNRTKKLCRCALFSAILCIFSMITIPISPIPVNLALFAVILAAVTLPTKECFVSIIVFIAIGAVGLPVFAGMQGGFGTLMGPTGGFIIGYIPCALLISLFERRSKGWLSAIGTALGCIICYACGCLWYCFTAGTDITSAFVICALPFIPADIIKGALAIVIGKKIKRLI